MCKLESTHAIPSSLACFHCSLPLVALEFHHVLSCNASNKARDVTSNQNWLLARKSHATFELENRKSTTDLLGRMKDTTLLKEKNRAGGY